MSTLVRATRVLVILMLAMIVISFIMALGTPDTGTWEKAVLLLLIGLCVYAAARVTALSVWMLHRLHH